MPRRSAAWSRRGLSARPDSDPTVTGLDAVPEQSAPPRRTLLGRLTRIARHPGDSWERLVNKLDRRIAMEEDWVRYGVSGRRKRNQGRLAKLQELRIQREVYPPVTPPPYPPV